MSGPKTYGMTFGNNLAMTLFGLFLLGCAYGVWTVNAPKTSSGSDWAMLLAIEAFFVALVVPMIGYRMEFSVDPERRIVSRSRSFFGLGVGGRTWSFGDFSAVLLSVHEGNRGARSARLLLELRAGGDPVLVNVYMMPGGLPEAAVVDAQSLAQTMGLPLAGPS